MSDKLEDEIGDDFSYIVRLRNTDLDGLKRLSTALTSINGIGARTSATVCRLSGLSPNQLTGNLTLEEQEKRGYRKNGSFSLDGRSTVLQ